VYAHHQLTRHGDPDEPLTDQELMDKFHELAEPRVGLDQAQALASKVLESPDMKVRKVAELWSKIST
jgi:hypothetical protein